MILCAISSTYTIVWETGGPINHISIKREHRDCYDKAERTILKCHISLAWKYSALHRSFPREGPAHVGSLNIRAGRSLDQLV